MRKVPFHLLAPFFLAVYPIVFFYGMNFYQIELADVLVTSLASLLVAVVVLLVSALLLRSWPRALFVTSLLLLLFFTFGHVYEITRHIRIRYFPFDKQPNLLILWGVLALAGIIFALKKPERLPGVNRYVGMIAGFLLVMNILNISYNAVTASAPPLPESGAFEVQTPNQLRDIYYIVLDEYSGNDVLVDQLGFDNSQFIQSLEERGFSVPSDARSNYYATHFSLASSLNMQYLDHLYGHRTDDLEPLFAMVRHNRTLLTLKRLGYTYIHFATGFPVTRNNPYADILYNGHDEKRIRLGDFIEFDPKPLRINDYHLALSRTTLLLPFVDTVEIEDSRARTLYNLEKLAEIPRMPEPTFVFAHFILPHFPYVFDRDDGPVNPDQPVDGQIVDQEKYTLQADYIDQLIYTNRVISQLVDTILEQSTIEPIILIQSDHGYRWICPDCFEQTRAQLRVWDADHYANVILPIFSAYYLPDGGQDLIYPTISPVNSFRIIFDHYFGANLGLIEDRYFKPEEYYERAYHFVDITDSVRYNREGAQASTIDGGIVDDT